MPHLEIRNERSGDVTLYYKDSKASQGLRDAFWLMSMQAVRGTLKA